MHKSKIEWCDHTLNVVTGCLAGCPYCYAENRIARFAGDPRFNRTRIDCYKSVRFPDDGPYAGHALYELDAPFLGENGGQIDYPFGFEPTFHKYRLNSLDNLKEGRNVFVGAMADLFGPWVPERWIQDVIGACEAHPRNNYLFMTRFPEVYERFNQYLPAPACYWYGTTVTGSADLARIGHLPQKKGLRYISFEPLHEGIVLAPEDWAGINWVIIGAETGRRKDKIVPEFDWIKGIVLRADVMGIPVFIKGSLLPIVGEKNMRREFPQILQARLLGEKREKKLYGDCLICKRKYQRSEMVTFSARVGRPAAKEKKLNKTICAMCRGCYEKWSAEHGLENFAPELYGEVQNEEKKLQTDEG